MKQLVALIILVLTLSACTISVYPGYRTIPEPIPSIYYLTERYEGYLEYGNVGTTVCIGDCRVRLVLDFRTMTYQLDGSYPTHMYVTGNEIILGEVGGYRLRIVNRGFDYLEGTWRFSSRIVDGGTFRVFANRVHRLDN